uniref:TF-B3 domain-containing protein n=1 Tax=Oryza brachyantha TaxID=4533 RepID=J3N1S1_ORYBR
MADKNSLLHMPPPTQQAQIAATPPRQYFSATYTIGHIKPHLHGKKTEITANTPGTAPSNMTVTMSTDGRYNITAGWTEFLSSTTLLSTLCSHCQSVVLFSCQRKTVDQQQPANLKF